MAKYRRQPWPAGSERHVIKALKEMADLEDAINALRRHAIEGKHKKLLAEWWEPLREMALNLKWESRELEYYFLEDRRSSLSWKSATTKLMQVADLIIDYLGDSQTEYRRKNYRGVGIYFDFIEQHILTMREDLTSVPFENDVVREAERIAREALNNG